MNNDSEATATPPSISSKAPVEEPQLTNEELRQQPAGTRGIRHEGGDTTAACRGCQDV